MVVLDTDLLVAYLREKENAHEIVQKLRKDGDNLYTTIFNAAELYKGSYRAKNIKKSLNNVSTLLTSLKGVLEFNDDAVQSYAKLSSKLKQKGEMVGTMDELIASICVAKNETFYTGNLRHFNKIEGLLLKNWRKLK